MRPSCEKLTYSGSTPTWQANNTQLTTRIDMLNYIKYPSEYSSPRTISIGGVATPYIFHTFNEWFKSAYTKTPWAPTDNDHILCLRTASQKLVYYEQWATAASTPSAQQPNFDSTAFDPTANPHYAADWSTANAEYYDYGGSSPNPTELENSFSASTILDIQSGFRGCVDNELQLALPSSLTSTQNAGILAFQTYITAPVVSAVTNSSGGSIAHNSSAAQTINVTAEYVLPGPTIVIKDPSNTPIFSDSFDDATSVANPIQLSVKLSVAGTYSITLTNPSALQSAVTFTVS